MNKPELKFSDTDLDELDKIKAAADTALSAQKPMMKAAAPEMGDEEIQIDGATD